MQARRRPQARDIHSGCEGWQTHRWSLWFSTPLSEAAFVASRHERVRPVFLAIRCVVLAASSLSFLAHIGSGNSSWTTHGMRGLEVLVNLLSLLLERSRVFRRWTPACTEAYMASHAATLPLTRVVANDYIMKIFLIARNFSPEDDVGPFQPYMYGGFVLGMMCICLVGSALPVRFVWLLPMDVVATVCFTAGVLVLPREGIPLPILSLHIVSFPMLLLLIRYMGRAHEKSDRELFARIAVEKTLRCQAEREAEAATASGGSDAPFVPEDDRRSSSVALSTTLSGMVFRAINKPGGDMLTTLEGIGNLGHEEHWLIGSDSLQFSQEPRILGHGGFGVIVPALYHGAGVVIKARRLRGECQSSLANIVHELRLLRRLRHPNLVAFFGASIDCSTAEVVVVLERIEGAQLGEVASCKEVGLPERVALAHDVVCAIAYLHAQDPAIVHGDIKAGNVLVERFPWRAKLLDFGLSRIMRHGAQRLGGTKPWAAPEVLCGVNAPDPSADIFSCGLLLFMVITGLHPRQMISSGLAPSEFVSHVSRSLEFMEEMPVAQEFVRLIGSCVHLDPSVRPTISEALQILAQWRSTAGAGGHTTQCLSSGPTASLPQALADARRKLVEDLKPSGTTCQAQGDRMKTHL